MDMSETINDEMIVSNAFVPSSWVCPNRSMKSSKENNSRSWCHDAKLWASKVCLQALNRTKDQYGRWLAWVTDPTVNSEQKIRDAKLSLFPQRSKATNRAAISHRPSTDSGFGLPSDEGFKKQKPVVSKFREVGEPGSGKHRMRMTLESSKGSRIIFEGLDFSHYTTIPYL